MNYWLFNAEEIDTIECDAADLWFKYEMGFSANDRKQYGDPLGKMKVGNFVLMYQNEKGYVGVGRVREEWNGKGYKTKLVYKRKAFDEYRIAIDWFFDARKEPFEIGYVSSRFLCRVKKPALLGRVKEIVRSASQGMAPRPMADEADDYIPSHADERRIFRSIKERRGQQPFRDKLKRRYGPACQITGCSIFDIVEAAHIHPYRGEKDNVATNGLLLRADIHTLFDLDLLSIHPETLRVHCTKQVMKEYGSQIRKTLICKNGKGPSKEALQTRFKRFSENS